MLQISRQDIDVLTSIKSQIDHLLSRTGVAIIPEIPTVSAACESCSGGCKGGCAGCQGCDGCKSTSTNTRMGPLNIDDIRTALDNLDTLGPVVFNKEFLSEIASRKAFSETHKKMVHRKGKG